jgi:hypothetical protein
MRSKKMKFHKSNLIALGTIGLLFLGACSGGTQENAATGKTETAKTETTNTTNTSSTSTDATKTQNSSTQEHNDKDHSHKHDKSQEGKEHSHGGQVVESGNYHLELASEKESNGTHLDFYLEKGEKHEVVPNAKVSAQVQLPDGSQKNLDLAYKSDEEHYSAIIPGNATGQYQVKVTADIAGEKVNGRFTVNQ